MGMMTRPGKESEEYNILTDIIGLEDFSGDMDFKVAGTDAGITAIQLDVKIAGLTIEQIAETIEKAKTARLFILGKMLAVLPEARKEVSAFAPKIEIVKIPVEKIGELIGPGGRVIKNIIATTGAAVDVEDDGTVSISGVSSDQMQQAVDWVKGLTREVVVGEEFEDAEVKRILPFGAFVEFLPGKEGMVHISQMSTEYVQNPTDVVQIGQKVKVRVAEIDDQGRINLSMLFGEDANKPKQPQQPRFQPENRGNSQDSREKPHPLSMQFRRERSQQREGFGQGRPAPRKRRVY
jgi:polyribonucleotide nucleotidyltransferase